MAPRTKYDFGDNMLANVLGIGQVQKEVLLALCRYKGWKAGCGWVQTNRLRTSHVLDSLVNRGLVSVTQGSYQLTKDGYDFVRSKLSARL
ncbi:hypothetical protein L1267_19110 [Pseudoalteromonas sp. OFAV1]|uniref:hypothetical protein n=1 Tax=Pseudoalteromonas sp. OFAV1 TaxID=2908892 RepID=UPI001F310EA1|nr:hypothetical protein [Pseudoalteromonas sp. OFAV1]MCF2902484.1 hypothetical protein [Pseudoalteromonas sp. OFAV1]